MEIPDINTFISPSILCVFKLNFVFSFCVGSADQFEEILCQYEELKVTQ